MTSSISRFPLTRRQTMTVKMADKKSTRYGTLNRALRRAWLASLPLRIC